MNQQEDKLFAFVESLWVFLPSGQIRLAPLSGAEMTENQAKRLKTYRNVLYGLMTVLLLLFVYPRIGTLLLAIILIPILIIWRGRLHRSLTAELGSYLLPSELI